MADFERVILVTGGAGFMYVGPQFVFIMPCLTLFPAVAAVLDPLSP